MAKLSLYEKEDIIMCIKGGGGLTSVPLSLLVKKMLAHFILDSLDILKKSAYNRVSYEFTLLELVNTTEV